MRAEIRQYIEEEILPRYDLFDKAQFHDADNAAYDERDTLLYFGGTLEDVTGKRYILTDDNAAMMVLNNDTPCWHLEQPSSGAVALTAIPHFSRMDGDRRWPARGTGTCGLPPPGDADYSGSPSGGTVVLPEVC